MTSIVMTARSDATADGGRLPNGRAMAWLKLAIGIAAILVFVFVIGPAVEKTPLFQPMATFIEERDIKATALFYSEIAEFSEGHFHMDNTRDYRPRP